MTGIIGKTVSLASALLLFALALAFGGARLAGLTPYATLGSSMEPAIHVGSMVYVRSATFADVNVGDCIMWNMGNGSICTHRVVEKSMAARTFATRGDANDAQDPGAVAEDALVGKVAFSVPLLGYLAQFWEAQPAAAVCGLVALVLMTLAPEIAWLFIGKPGRKEPLAQAANRPTKKPQRRKEH